MWYKRWQTRNAYPATATSPENGCSQSSFINFGRSSSPSCRSAFVMKSLELAFWWWWCRWVENWNDWTATIATDHNNNFIINYRRSQTALSLFLSVSLDWTNERMFVRSIEIERKRSFRGQMVVLLVILNWHIFNRRETSIITKYEEGRGYRVPGCVPTFSGINDK